MRNALLLLFLAISLTSYSQSARYRTIIPLLDTVETQIWNSIPQAPFSPTTTLTYASISSGSGGIASGDIGGHTDIGVSGVWDRMRIDNLSNIRITNINASTQIGNRDHGNWEDWICFDAINGSNNVEVWGKSVNEPFWLDGNDNGGFSWIGGASQSIIKGYNILATNQGWASIFMNSGNGYDSIEVIGFKNFGADDDGEVTYVGETDKDNTIGTVKWAHLKDIVGYGRGRDGNQMNNHLNLNIDAITVHNVGLANMSSQRALFQYQNSRGIVKNSIFHNAPSAGIIAGHGLVLFNNYYRWESGNLIHQNISTEYSGISNPDKLPGRNRLPVFYIECDFAPEATGYITVQDSESDIVLIDCNFNSNMGGGIFQDSRSDGTTHSLQNVNGTTGATIPEPTYTNFTPTDHANSGLCIEEYHYDKARGFRTKDSRKRAVPVFEVISITPLTDIEVDEGTAFVDIPLPRVVQVTIDGTILSSPINVKLPVTWDEGDYDGDVQDTYEITGTFDLPSWYIIKNTGVLTATIDVEVVEPDLSFNPYLESDLVAGFNPLDAVSDLVAGTPFWTNRGSGSNAGLSVATALPTSVNASTRTGKGVQFVKASGQGMGYGTGTVTSPFESWYEVITPSSFSGTNTIHANGSTPRVDFRSGGQIHLNGTATGINLSASTRYVIRVVSDGASSSITLNNGTPATVVLGSSSNGSSTPKLGTAYSAGSYLDGVLGDILQFENIKDSTFIGNMWDWFGF